MSAFRISADRPGGEELARIMAVQHARAHAALSAWRADPEGAFYETRRRLKKVRAAARLAREIDNARARAIIDACRAAGQTLGAGRDADVVRRTAFNLAGHIDHPDVTLALHRFIAAHSARDQGRFDRDDAAAQALAAMDQAAPLLGELRQRPTPDMALHLAAVRIVRRANRTFAAARSAALAGGAAQGVSAADAEARHEWRKRVKDLGYAARLLRDVWPLGGEPPIEAARQLGQLLGQERDLTLLAEALRQETATPSGVLMVVENRRAELARDADILGRKLHDDRDAAPAAPPA